MSSAQPAPACTREADLLRFPAPRERYDMLALWHLLSLDAPTVATLWLIFLVREAHTRIGWATSSAMFLCVWMLYVADRLLDTRDMPPQSADHDAYDTRDLEARHLFHYRHRRLLVPMLFAAAALLAMLLPQLEATTLRLYAALTALLAAYFFLIHIYFQPAARLPKEFAVGCFFAAAVFVPALQHLPALRLLPYAAAFAAVCTLNCLYLYTWEHPGPRDNAHITTRFATSHLSALTTTVLFLDASLVFLDASLRSVAYALLLSTCLLRALHISRRRLSPLRLRAAADLALLTPLLFLASR